jgi:hypothetical protein
MNPSSEPLTMYFPDVTENALKAQYDVLTCDSYVFRHFPCGDESNTVQ